MSAIKILVADDDPVYLDLMREVLSDAGYRDVVCVAGMASHAQVKHERPDVILLDVNVNQRANGLGLLDALRRDDATAHIPVIVCSTDNQLPKAHPAPFADGRCSFLEKPFALDALLCRVASSGGCH
jgi:CheY-like chemotaxis protein